jgi:predicted PurR-regulated permease PerM
MNQLLYLKAVIGAVGANVFPPIADWLVNFIPAPDKVHAALSILLVALLTGGAVYATSNKTPQHTVAADESPPRL